MVHWSFLKASGRGSFPTLFILFFAAIVLRSGQVIMTYNLGSGGTSVLTSNVVDGTSWAVITAQIDGANSRLQLNNGPAAQGRGELLHLHLVLILNLLS